MNSIDKNPRANVNCPKLCGQYKKPLVGSKY